jgi:hypothetical protein
MMKVFNVWIRRMDGAFGLRVDGLKNAEWLLDRLSGFFVFKTCEPLREVPNSSNYTFRVAHNSQMPVHRFEKLLAGIAELKIFLEPAHPSLAVGQRAADNGEESR